MFSTVDIQEFKMVWIAGTMGKKLGKKQVSAVDISDTVNRIVSREYQLRTNSQLMLGIIKIYKLKTDYLYSDAQHALLQFKRFFAVSHDRSVQVQEARQETITIQENEMLNELDPEGVFKVPPPFGFSLDTSLSSFDELVKSSPFSFTTQSGSLFFQSLQDIPTTPIGSTVILPNTPGLSSIPRTSPGILDSVLSKGSRKSILLQDSSPHLAFDAMQSSSDRDVLDILSQHEVDLFDDLRDDFQIASSHDFDIVPDPDISQPVFPDADFEFQTLNPEPSTPVVKKGGLPTPKTHKQKRAKRNLLDTVIYLNDNDMHEMRRITDAEITDAPIQQYRDFQKAEAKRIVAEIIGGFPRYLNPIYKKIFNQAPEPVLKKPRLTENGGVVPEYPIEEEVGRYIDYDDFPVYQEASPPKDNGLFDDVEGEVGRSMRGDFMPWHQPSITTMTGSRKSSIGSTPLQGRSSDTNSLATPLQNMDIDTNLNLFIHDTQTRIAELDNETVSFFVYVESLMHETNSAHIFLGDIIQDGNRTTASLAFFNTLALATRNKFHVHQEKAFGDIEIGIA